MRKCGFFTWFIMGTRFSTQASCHAHDIDTMCQKMAAYIQPGMCNSNFPLFGTASRCTYDHRLTRYLRVHKQ